MTVPKNREELRHMVSAHTCGDHVRADDFLSALDSAGLAIVPKEPDFGMRRQATVTLDERFKEGDEIDVIDCYRAMLSASPYRGKE